MSEVRELLDDPSLRFRTLPSDMRNVIYEMATTNTKVFALMRTDLSRNSAPDFFESVHRTMQGAIRRALEYPTACKDEYDYRTLGVLDVSTLGSYADMVPLDKRWKEGQRNFPDRLFIEEIEMFE